MISVKKISVVKKNKLTDVNDDMKKLLNIMRKNNIENPEKYLPDSDYFNVSFELRTYTSFANAVRRYLIEELVVDCLDIDETDIITTDEFLITDVVKKNINLIPINQDFDKKVLDKMNLCIDVFNNTNKHKYVMANDIILFNKQIDQQTTYKEKKSSINIKKLIPDNVPILMLGPAQRLTINNINIVSGMSKDDASKFSLLDSVSYKPIGYTPYNNFTKEGVRSSDINPNEFKISFTTTGNISVKKVFEKMSDGMRERLNNIRQKLVKYDVNPENY